MKVTVVGKIDIGKYVCYHCIEHTPAPNQRVCQVISSDRSICVDDVCFVYSYCFNGNWYKKIKKGE